MSAQSFVTNLELRESNPDGTEGAGLSHTAEGLFLLHVLEMAAQGEPKGGVAIVHGAGDHGGRYQELGEILTERGWAVALPDLRGHGQSEGERGHSWGMPEPVRDLASVLDHLAYRLPDAPKAIVATGLGGLYALAFALDHPDALAKLVLVNPLLDPKPEAPAKKGGLKGLFGKPKPTDPGRWTFGASELLTDAAEQRAWESDQHTHGIATLHVAQHLPDQAKAVRERAGSLTTETLLVLGEADTVADPALAERLLDGKATVRRVAGARHDLLHEASWRDEAQAIAEWLGG